MKNIRLKIGGMSCSACSSGLEKYLNRQKGIVNANVNLVLTLATIEYDETKLKVEDIERFVQEAGFESLGIEKFQEELNKQEREKNQLIIVGMLVLIIFLISMGNMSGLLVIPFFDMHINLINYTATLFILTILTVILGRDILIRGIKHLVHKNPNMDSLVAIGVISALGYSVYGTIQILNGNNAYVESIYYESAAMILFFIKLGKYIENRNKFKTKKTIQDLMRITPNKATIIRENEEIEVTLDEIKKGDIVICKPGEKIAVDGLIIQGSTHINESFITGESVPVSKKEKDSVIAGSINYDGTIQYKAEKIGKDSTVSEIVRLVVNMANTKPPIAKIADKVSGLFVPAILIIAVITFIAWLIIGKDFAFSINIFISILVIACPCALGLATPLAIVIASGVSAKNGILIKDSSTLEICNKVDTIIFDKTGTLTKGELEVTEIICSEKEKRDKILQMVASIEKLSEHPIGEAIVKEAENMKLSLFEVEDFKVIPGYGAEGIIENAKVQIGNRAYMEKENIEITFGKEEEQLTKKANSIVYVAIDNKMVCLIGVKDELRENIDELISDLQKRKIETIMLTGDNEKTAKQIGKEIGIKNIIANVIPQEKAKHIQKLKEHGKTVMMVGDGINDAPSLVTADVGVSIANGTDIAMDSSQIVFMKNDLAKIQQVLELSKKTIRNIKQNLFWAFFYNLCMIPIAAGALISFGIVMNPMFAAISMTLSSLTVVFNALRLRNIKLKS